MKRLSIPFVLLVCFVLWWRIAADYGDGVVSGTYYFSQNGETSSLVLHSDHSFTQDLTRDGKLEHAAGTWRRIGEGGIVFSKEFLIISGQERSADGTAFGDIHKDLGVFVFLTLRQYHVLFYGRVDHAPSKMADGTYAYAGDQLGVSATLTLKPDHTFEQVIHTSNITSQAKGDWSVGQNGDFVFSKAFLKASGEMLSSNETATARNPKGSNLQIEIATTGTGVPTFRKKPLF